MAAVRERSLSAPASGVNESRPWLAPVVSGVFYVIFTYVLVQYVRVLGSDVFATGTLAALFLGAVLVLERLLGRNGWVEHHRRAALALGFAAVLALQLLYVREIYTTIGWDPRVVFAAAIDLSHFSQSPLAVHTPEMYLSPGFAVQYWGEYPNNLLLVFIYELVFRACATLGISSAVYMCTCLNVLVLDVAILLAVLCAGRMWGREAQRVTFLIAVPFLAFSPWISVAYSDTIATVIPVLLLYLYLRYLASPGRLQFGYVALIGATSAVGYLLKPHVVAMTLAIGIAHTLSGGSRSSLATRVYKLVTAILVAIMVVGVFGAYRDYRLKDRITPEQVENLRFPATHFIAMSLNDETGGFNQKDVEEERALVGVAAKQERNARVIRRRLMELGPLGYAGFLNRKLTWMTTDGTFYWQREGNSADYLPFHEGRFARIIQSVVFRSGARYDWYSLVANAGWLALLLAMVAPAATSRRFVADRALIAARLATVILLMMLLVLEGRSRYLISFFPVFVLLSSGYLAGLSHGGVPWWRAIASQQAD